MEVIIRNRHTGDILISGAYRSIKDCLEKNRSADLRGANLEGAYLQGANLRGANLRDIKEYSQSHDIFKEAIRQQTVSVFSDAEWVAIAQITIHTLCWDSIKKRFPDVMPHIFEVLAEEGFGEYLEYWKEITK